MTDAELVDAIEAKLGPITGGQILVLRGDVSFFGDEGDPAGRLLEELVACVHARGLTGDAAEHVPLVLWLPEGTSIELLDEVEMRAAGWVRG